MHLRERSGNILLIGVVKREAHTQNIAPYEALPGVGGKSLWIVVATTVEQESGDEVNFPAVESFEASRGRFDNMHDADDDRSFSRPLDASTRIVNGAAVLTDPAKSSGPRIALADVCSSR